MNTVIAVFANGGTMTTTQTALWQYDYGQVLIVQGIQLPTSYEVQFCNAGDSTTITSLGDSEGVVIPDQFLQNGETIYAYIYLHTGPDDGETEYKITIPVMDRAEPTDIQPTPQQESTIWQLVSALNDAVSHVDDVADGIPTAIDTALAEAKASGEFDGPQGERGPRGYSVMAVSKVYHNSTTDDIYCLYDDISTGFGASPTVGDLLVGPSNGTTNPGSFVYQISGLQISPRGFKLNWIGRIKGANGADGYSPTVTVTEITGGHRITITDVNGDHTFDVMDGTGGGGGTSDYDDLSNKPQIGGVTLSGNKSLSDLGIAAASDIPAVPVQSVNNKTGTVVLTASDVGAGTYSKPSGGIPKTDLASGVQTSLGLADTAYQKPSGGIPASDLASGVIPSVPSASSATPQALGTAEAGSSADYSRADHKHDFNSDFVTALLQIASKVAYIDDHGATYYAALESALTHRTLSSISAVYTQSGTVYGTDTLDSLKADLVVTATYSDSSTATVAAADYTLSGTLTTGTSTITVSYGGKTTAFSVTVMENPIPAGYTVYDYIYNKHTNNNDISVDTQLGGAFCGTNYEHELTFLVTNAATSTSYPMYGLRATTGSDPRARALWSKATTNGNLACNYNGVDTGFVFNMATNTKYKCVTGNSQWKMNDVVIQDNMDGSSYTPPTTGTIRIFGIQTGSEVRAGYTRHNMRVYEFKVTDLTTGDVVADLIPVMNESGTAGLYDIVNKRFCTAIVASTIGAGND